MKILYQTEAREVADVVLGMFWSLGMFGNVIVRCKAGGRCKAVTLEDEPSTAVMRRNEELKV